MGKCELFKSFRGSAPDPAGGLIAPPPQTPSWKRAVLRTACLASQDIPSSFFSHSSYFGRTGFFFVATALAEEEQCKKKKEKNTQKDRDDNEREGV